MPLEPFEKFEGRPRSLSGTRPEGVRPVRFIYLDEAGTSATEDLCVVAGVIVDIDHQFQELETYVQALIDKHVTRPEFRKGFAFHAKDMVGRKPGTFWENCPEDALWKAFYEVIEIPRRFGLPIVVGYARRTAELLKLQENLSAETKQKRMQMHGYTMAISAAERYMRNIARKDEMGIVVAEDNPPVHKAIKKLHGHLRDADWVSTYMTGTGVVDYFPIRRIIDTVHFAAKSEALLLQLADMCAFGFKRIIRKARYSDEILRAIVDPLPPSADFTRETDSLLMCHEPRHKRLLAPGEWVSLGGQPSSSLPVRTLHGRERRIEHSTGKPH